MLIRLNTHSLKLLSNNVPSFAFVRDIKLSMFLSNIAFSGICQCIPLPTFHTIQYLIDKFLKILPIVLAKQLK